MSLLKILQDPYSLSHTAEKTILPVPDKNDGNLIPPDSEPQYILLIKQLPFKKWGILAPNKMIPYGMTVGLSNIAAIFLCLYLYYIHRSNYHIIK